MKVYNATDAIKCGRTIVASQYAFAPAPEQSRVNSIFRCESTTAAHYGFVILLKDKVSAPI
jgi:hypothetical protein